MSQASYALGLDLGGTKILAGLVDASGRVHHEWRIPTPAARGGEAILQALSDALGAVLGKLTPEERRALVGVGISSAGHIDRKTGGVVYCTPNLPGWTGMRVIEELERAHGLRTVADNDGNCAAYGEYWLGAGKGIANMVALTLGTGLGGGILSDGKLVRGARGGGAEIGHLILVPDGLPCNCGQKGCFETYVSGTALGKAAERSGYWSTAPSSHEVFGLAREGEAHALELVRQMAYYFAVGLVTVVNIVDPERIVVGGGVASQGDFFLPMVRELLPGLFGERGWESTRLQLAALGEAAGMIGAAGEALARFGALEAVC